jgi:hypothetical protein
MDLLQQLLQESLSFTAQEKQNLLDFFQKNPEKVDQGIKVLQEEHILWEENQKKYVEEVTHVAEGFVSACAQKDKEEKMKIYAGSRSKVKKLLDQEKAEKEQEASDLDSILSTNS